MLPNDQALLMLAKAREQEFLEAAETNRMLRLLDTGKETQPTMWRQVSWQFGRLLITLGQRLQTQQKVGY